MKLLWKRMLATILLLLMAFSMLPATALADDGEEEGSISPVPDEESSGEIRPVEETKREEETLCILRFVCRPEDTRVLVRDPTRQDENGEFAVVEPEKDGSWKLKQGEYLFSAWHKGYEPAELVSFFTDGLTEKTIDLTLRPQAPVSGHGWGDEIRYEQAYPLPALTGDQAADTANVARSQLGYTYSEGTVYGAWWTEVTSWGWDYTKDDWCAMFACWCSTQAGVGLDKAYSKYGANANYLMEWQVEHCTSDKTFTTEPRAGDFLFFGGSDGRAGHVGIVTSYDAGAKRVNFIGGNQGSPSRVSEGSVKWGEDSYWGYQVVLGYGRPSYSSCGEAPKAGLDAASGGDGTISVSGWAFDPDDPDTPVWIHVYVGGPAGSGARRYDFEAKAYREDVEANYPGAGLYHGFYKSFSVYERGVQTLYFYAYDLGPVQQEILFAQAEVNITSPMLIFYTVSYDANGGSGAPEDQVKSHNVPLVLSSAEPTRDEEQGSFTVTLDPCGGTVSSESLSSARTTSYRFREWNTAADGSGTCYAPGATYTANAGATLYAQWDSSSTAEAVLLPTPLRPGYAFLGWSLEKNGAPSFSGSYTPSGDVTLYAVWEALGDSNGDGLVDLLDLVRLRKYLAGVKVELSLGGADLNGDGEITVLDLVQLRKLLVGSV